MPQNILTDTHFLVRFHEINQNPIECYKISQRLNRNPIERLRRLMCQIGFFQIDREIHRMDFCRSDKIRWSIEVIPSFNE